jgi:TIR domain-containing protein
MSGNIFINYRRADAPDSAGRLYDVLESHFGPQNLFMDVEDSVKPGEDFVDVIENQIFACGIVVVVIGPNWLKRLREKKKSELDFVVFEIESAIKHNKKIVPVFVFDGTMPPAKELPESIKTITRLHAVTLRSDRFKSDCRGLIGNLEDCLKADVDNQKKERVGAPPEHILSNVPGYYYIYRFMATTEGTISKSILSISTPKGEAARFIASMIIPHTKNGDYLNYWGIGYHLLNRMQFFMTNYNDDIGLNDISIVLDWRERDENTKMIPGIMLRVSAQSGRNTALRIIAEKISDDAILKSLSTQIGFCDGDNVNASIRNHLLDGSLTN